MLAKCVKTLYWCHFIGYSQMYFKLFWSTLEGDLSQSKTEIYFEWIIISFLPAKGDQAHLKIVIYIYITNFKERYRNHKTSFRHSKRRNETQLSKYVWNLQNEKKPFQIKWKILKKCKPYSNVSKKCSICLNEKFIIICKKELFL